MLFAMCLCRTCLRGWACELRPFIGKLIAWGSVAFTAELFLFGGVIYWFGEKGGKLRHGVHWVFILTFPVWAAWFGFCCYDVAMHKTTAYRYVLRHLSRQRLSID